MRNKKCKSCGKPFFAPTHNTKYCSPECAKAAKKKREHQYWEDKKEQQYDEKKDPKSALSEINSLAIAAGMSYGKYVAMKYIEEQRNVSTM